MYRRGTRRLTARDPQRSPRLFPPPLFWTAEDIARSNAFTRETHQKFKGIADPLHYRVTQASAAFTNLQLPLPYTAEQVELLEEFAYFDRMIQQFDYFLSNQNNPIDGSELSKFSNILTRTTERIERKLQLLMNTRNFRRRLVFD